MNKTVFYALETWVLGMLGAVNRRIAKMLHNVPDPTNDTDAANKRYVDEHADGAPTVTISQQQVISQSPITVQFTDAQAEAIERAISTTRICFLDMTDLDYGAYVISFEIDIDGTYLFTFVGCHQNYDDIHGLKYDSATKCGTMIYHKYLTTEQIIPRTTASDNGKILKVVNGKPQWVTA